MILVLKDSPFFEVLLFDDILNLHDSSLNTLLVLQKLVLIYNIVTTLRKLIMSMNTSNRVGQCAIVLSSLSLFNYSLNEAACPPVSTVYSPVMPSEGIYTLIRVY